MNKILTISIITPSFNHSDFIEDTITSVINQDYEYIEHIVVDGGSTDSTIEILKKYDELKWISEKDNGQASAINKGFRMATGEIVSWLNSDDYLAPNSITKVAKVFAEKPEIDFVYGDIIYVNKGKSTIEEIIGEKINYDKLLRNPDIVRQPSTFWRKSVLDKIGYIDENLELVMDYDFFLKLFKNFSFEYIPVTLSYYREYSDTKTSKQNRKQVMEILKVISGHTFFFSPKLLWKLIKRYWQ
ncbi:MAG: glycosyltransferase [Melioribacteraceae bacterium]|nr:glycosyltransferase [Melioribacteraceae bacterium]MCF8264208.1 glycosyltransferase [Melioribacteraceae bacterium]MCF8412178.1 glycosyltransferase [Melioribacteraceae bacterium]